ncbi:hypothetical protein Rumeso_00498 [Rubellimicrobium mesophilum DSM 19309]|uniref:Uncharacterized protein n=2 Tax=Rubellimicrobium TaxID=295418 RepID=A0A017HTP7_9RHOB|nr:hypothetical protein Rumeso_00498 [Rubellimicrobium mesophilum DSM 19309]
MADEVWLSEKDAIETLKQSDWGMLRIPHITETVNRFDTAGLAALLGHSTTRTIAGMSDAEKGRRKYLMFLGRTLRSFAESNPEATRQVDDKQEYERGALLKFLDLALEDELEDEFGRVPSYRVKD